KLLDRDGDEAKGGTAEYMSPEQARGDPDVGIPSDVYGLGAILYELLTGRPPFRGADRDEVLRRVLNDEPTPPRELRPGIPRDLDAIGRVCLHKSPQGRSPTAAELAADLHKFLTTRPVKARPVPWWDHVRYAARRHPRVASLIGTFVLLLAAVGSW